MRNRKLTCCGLNHNCGSIIAYCLVTIWPPCHRIEFVSELGMQDIPGTEKTLPFLSHVYTKECPASAPSTYMSS